MKAPPPPGTGPSPDSLVTSTRITSALESLLISLPPQGLAQPCAQPVRESTSSIGRMSIDLDTKHDLTPLELQ
ncbi:hypothetical protein GE21DRAFT_1028582 [Neurospora crassa]|nr:hypothetical protein GE21DRAFT_1028582 [Neurospora crassa]